MNIHELIEKAENEGLTSTAKYVSEHFDRVEAAMVLAAIENVIKKQSNFLKIDIDTGDQKKMLVQCPLFEKPVHIQEVCYGCRFNPGTGRWEGKDGEYFQCNFNPNTDTPVWPATRDIQRPTISTKKEAKGGDIQVGDTVMYSKKFLQDTGQYTGSIPHAVGKVTDIQGVGGSLQLAIIDWGDKDIPPKVNVKNLVKKDRIQYEESSREDTKKKAIDFSDEYEDQPDSLWDVECPNCGEKLQAPEFKDEPLRDWVKCPNCKHRITNTGYDIDEVKDETENLDPAYFNGPKSEMLMPPKKKAQEEIVEEKVTLPDDEELSRFDGLTADELHSQLQMYRELQKVLQDSPPGENIKVQDTIRIIDYIENLINSPQSVTPQELQESPEGATIEEIPAEEVDEVKQEMAIAASLIKEAPDILDRCVRDVMKDHEGDGNFDQSNAYAICITSLRDKHPSVEEWVHKKKAEVETMEKIENVDMSKLTIPALEKRLDTLREAEFVVRASMNVNSDASMSEGTRLLGKIKDEKDRINQLLSYQLMPFKEETLDQKFAYDPEQIKDIPHKVVEEFKKVAKVQSEFDWETYLEVTPKLLVEQNPILHEWPALMAEAARQEIFTKISALPVDKRQAIFMEFMENVEEERKLATGEITSKKKKCRHMNEDNTFKGGFDGCKAHFMECKGLPAENAEKMCSYINRRKGATEQEIIQYGERKGFIEKKAEIVKEASTPEIDPQQLFI